MTYEEIVERVRKKSSICPECGCFISSLLDCCPACGWKAEKKNENAAMSKTSEYNKNELRDYYKSIGGNARVDLITKKISEFATINGIEFSYVYVPSEMRYIFDFEYMHQGRAYNYRQTFNREQLINYESYYGDSLIIRIVDHLKSRATADIYDAIGGNYMTTLYADDKPFLTEYVPDVDYTSYYKAKTDTLQTQQRTMRLYEEAIKSINSYSGNKVALDILEEEIERVKDYYL